MIRHGSTYPTSRPRAWTRWGALVVLVALLGTRAPLPAHAASDPLDGRLGGTFQSLVDRLGEPVETTYSLGAVFAVDDTGYVAVHVHHSTPTYAPSDPALLITISADREADRPASAVDPGDWTLPEAMAVAADFAPADATLAAIDDPGQGASAQSCESPALLDAFGDSGRGQCRVAYLLSSPETVSFVTLGFAAAAVTTGEGATPVPACAGVEAWAAGAAGRLEEAQRLLDGLSRLSDDPDQAVISLRGLTDAFRDLADEQRTADAPPEVATANYYLIGALTDFAGALEDAADGLATPDQALIDAAAEDLAAADARATDAAAEITESSRACGLDLDPTAGG